MTHLGLRPHLLILLSALFAAVGFIPPASFAYDGHSTVAAKRVGPLPAGEAPYQLKLFPDEAYNRVQHYGRTPTAQQRASVPSGMEFDHDPTLVQHYYEGANGGLPGFNLTQTERLQHARSLTSGGAATPAQQRAQGAAAAAYSKEQKRLWGLE